MKLTLHRELMTEHCTFGSLYIDDKFECFTLEDIVRDVKIPKVTAIPSGTYDVDLTDSVRFKELLPILIDVPNYTGVRIHSGNTDEDTEGCILVGTVRDISMNKILFSRVSLNNLMVALKSAKARGEKIIIEIINDITLHMA